MPRYLSLDEAIECSSQVLRLVRLHNTMLEKCAHNSIYGEYIGRPYFAEEFRRLAAESREIERDALLVAKYLGNQIVKAQKAPDQIRFSAIQVATLTQYLSMMGKPLFPELGPKAALLHPGLHTESPLRDC